MTIWLILAAMDLALVTLAAVSPPAQAPVREWSDEEQEFFAWLVEIAGPKPQPEPEPEKPGG